MAEAARVSVGLPVRNGMPHLVESLSSLQAQTYPTIMIHISDNASDDGTEAYCRAIAADDPRVVYRKRPMNIGASRNFNEVFRETNGEYFSWAAHDDRFHPDYVAHCVAALERSPEYAMVVPWIRFVDEAGRPGDVLRERADLGSADPTERIRCFLDRHEWFMLYGVARHSVLATTGLFPTAFGADVALLWEMLLRHRIGVVPEVLFEYRRYRDKSVERVHAGLLGEAGGATPTFLHVRLWRTLWDAAAAPELPRGVRRQARSRLLRWLPSGDFRDLFFADLTVELLRATRARSPLRAVPAAAGMFAVRPGRAVRSVRRSDSLKTLARAARR